MILGSPDYLCVSVQVLPLTDEVKFVNVLDVVAFATPSMVKVTPLKPPEPAPMNLHSPPSPPLVAVTFSTPLVMVMEVVS